MVCFYPVAPFPLPGIVSHDSRWVAAAILWLIAITAAIRKPERSHLQGAVIAPFLAFGSYAMLSGLWSQNPAFTYYKGAAFFLAPGALFIGGYVLTGYDEHTNPFDCLRWVFLNAVLFTALSLVLVPGRAIQGGLLSGYTQNANYLGAMIVWTIPWVLMELFLRRNRPVNTCLLVAACLFVFVTHSRASFLAGCTLFAFVFAKHLRRHALITLLALAIVIVFAIASPTIISEGHAIVYKDTTGTQTDAFESRRGPWIDSWEGAKAGGFAGIGFGISNGLSSNWSGELGSLGFVREKGNSQLAIVEELGLVGLLLYVALLLALYLGMRRLYLAGPRVPRRLMVYRLAVGFLLATMVHSAFEAWFTSPGADDTAGFWVIMGVSLGWLRWQGRRRASYGKYSTFETYDRSGALGRRGLSSLPQLPTRGLNIPLGRLKPPRIRG